MNVNKTVEALARIIEWRRWRASTRAGTRPPARPSARRSRSATRGGTWLDYDLLICALDAAADLDANSPRRDYRNLARTIVFALLFIGGLRVTEVCLLRWRHVDFARGVIPRH